MSAVEMTEIFESQLAETREEAARWKRLSEQGDDVLEEVEANAECDRDAANRQLASDRSTIATLTAERDAATASALKRGEQLTEALNKLDFALRKCTCGVSVVIAAGDGAAMVYVVRPALTPAEVLVQLDALIDRICENKTHWVDDDFAASHARIAKVVTRAKRLYLHHWAIAIARDAMTFDRWWRGNTP